MKKMILGLALCLGLSQAAVAQKDFSLAQLTEKETQGALAWIKNNPKKSIAIGAAIAATLTYGSFAAVEIYKADGKDGKWQKTKTGLTEAAKDLSVYPARFALKKTVAGKDWVVSGVKAHPVWTGVSTAVVVVIAAAVIAELTTDEESNLRVTNLWNKLFKKSSTEEVVA